MILLFHRSFCNFRGLVFLRNHRSRRSSCVPSVVLYRTGGFVSHRGFCIAPEGLYRTGGFVSHRRVCIASEGLYNTCGLTSQERALFAKGDCDPVLASTSNTVEKQFHNRSKDIPTTIHTQSGNCSFDIKAITTITFHPAEVSTLALVIELTID
jgi:hypothetical protein